MDIYGGTAILVIAATLLCAAVAKTRHLQSFELSLVRLLPRGAWRGGFTSRSLAWAVIMAELGTAAALFLAPGSWLTALTAWAAMLFAVFTGAAVIMMRRRVPCGCFGASSSHPQLLDLARNLVLVLLACSTAALTGSGAPADRYEWPTVGIAAVSVILILVSAASRTRKITANWVSGMARPAGPDSVGRRTFLRLAISGIAVGTVIGSVATATPAFAVNLSCQARYNRCYGCNPNQNQCCINCYISCIDGGDTCLWRVSCGGCWPAPSL
jgi:uncharacterized membrane protein